MEMQVPILEAGWGLSDSVSTSLPSKENAAGPAPHCASQRCGAPRTTPGA